jgi:hypothetical protein
MINVNLHRLFINELGSRATRGVLFSENDIFKIEYVYNNFGFRGKDFKKENEILALGCSHTYGDGTPENDVWINILAKKLNLNVSNLAIGGESTILQIMKAFYYFEQVGHPKMIIGLFPLFRMPTTYVPEKMQRMSSKQQEVMLHSTHNPYVENAIINNEFDKYSKAPYNPDTVLPKEFAFFYEKAMIDILRQYCKSNNIIFFWSCWDIQYQTRLYSQINSFYKNHHDGYCYIDAFNWKKPESHHQDYFGEFNALDCHNEYRHNELFYRAADRVNGKFPHWGIHKNMHIADSFYDFIKTNLN